jgi:hypothetical protein
MQSRTEDLSSAERRLVASIKRRQQRRKRRWQENAELEGFAPFFGLI